MAEKAEVASPPNHATEPASALCDYMDELVESLRKLVPAALEKFDEDAIHQSRVATRRLKAAVDLMEPALSEDQRKPFAKVTRKLRRRLGPMRDLDVMVGHLQTLQRRATHRTAAKWLEERLLEARESAREDSNEAQSPSRVLAQLGCWWGLREEVRKAGDQARSLLANALHLQLDAFAEQADLLAKNDPSVRQDPHQLRIAGKALRYTLEMARHEGHEIPGKVAKAFKQMQDSLGTWHDFVVLTERAMSESLAALLAHHEMQLQRQMLDMARMTLGIARKELDQFSSLWAKDGAELLAIIRQAVPLAVVPAMRVTVPLAAPLADAAVKPDAEEIVEPAAEAPVEPAEPITESKTDRDPPEISAPAVAETAPATDPEAA